MAIREELKKAVGYCRVSTSGQAEDDKYGLSVQKEEITKYAKEHGYRIVQWCEDVVSGVSDEKPSWDKILFGMDVVNPPFEAVIVFKSDRVSRDIKQYFYYLFLLEKKNVNLISVNEDFTGDFANIYRAIILYCAEQERKNIAIRTSYGRKQKALHGGFAGGRASLGYDVQNGQLVINEKEAIIIKEIFKMADDNVPQIRIAEYLNAQGWRGKGGTAFNQPKVHYILDHKKFYQGYIKYGGKKAQWVKGVHTPIIDE